MLIDSGSTHNVVSLSTAKCLVLSTRPCSPVSVIVANGARLSCDRQVKRFQWRMADAEFKADMLVMPIGGYNVILGVNWMQLVSPIVFDFQQGRINVNWKKKRIQLVQAATLSSLTVVSKKKNKKWINKEDNYFLIQVMAVSEKPPQEDIPQEIKSLLDEYMDVFAEPKGLPPPRSHDHRIPLKTDSSPVNSNPYKCPYV
ncbi:uncharacterized protein LOC141665930 [Apium graveolens]|uniref:uncharacterized protein LOC141665930 n=1 Tax=Apium graveolens TaxID=4045 RepID=UPI003D7BCDC7